MNFTLNILMWSVKIYRESIYKFAKAKFALLRQKIRVNATLKYCLNGYLFVRRFTGSFFTFIVIHTFAAPPSSRSYWWRSRLQSKMAQTKFDRGRAQRLKKGNYLSAKMFELKHDGLAWLPIEIWNQTLAGSKNSGNIVSYY